MKCDCRFNRIFLNFDYFATLWCGVKAFFSTTISHKVQSLALVIKKCRTKMSSLSDRLAPCGIRDGKCPPT